MFHSAIKKVILICGLLIPAAAMAGGSFPFGFVTNGQDSGYGSLRDALESGKSTIIIFHSVDQIAIESPLQWVSKRPLKIIGSGQVITGDNGSEPLLEITRGANLSIKGLEFAGPGGYSILNQGGGKGIFVKVPADRKGVVRLSLRDVTVRDTGNHGVHVSDCSIGDDCGGGQGGGGEGSDASVSVWLNNVTIDGAGFGKQDADGLRVDDRGPGGISLNAKNITFINVGGDGIELDEGNEGNVAVLMRHAYFADNGAYCSDDFVADPIGIDPACDDDGDPDVDDAFDIDEAGPGGIWGIVNHADVINNYDEGFDFDSEGEGDYNFVNFKFIDIYGIDNDDEAIKVSEEGDADVYVKVRSTHIAGDVEVEEEDVGGLHVVIESSSIGDDLKLSESGDGDGTVKLCGTSIGDDKDYGGDGITEL